MSNPVKNYLVGNGFLTDDAFTQAENLSQQEGISLMTSIERLNLLEEDPLLDIFSKMYRIPKVSLGEMDIPRQIIELIPREVATKYKVLPIDRAGNNIIIAMSDPRNLAAIDAIRFTVGFFPKPVLTTEVRVKEALEKYYGSRLNLENLNSATQTVQIKQHKQAERVDIATGDKDDGPIIKLVNQILMECLRRKASDIHLEPYEHHLRVRLRIDGVLHEIARPPKSMKAALTSRIKIMSNLDIAETRLPQDGAINIQIGDKPVDFRVSCLPVVHGEKIVMRILDKSSLQVDMTKLGFDEDELSKFIKSIHNPFGMVLVTGPTGSGKTTTLYSALSELNTESDNLMTAEDPVEFNIDGINQVQMKPDIGLNFASALRSFLRQDPDIIMVGEIRDLETAEIAIKAALTGHMVLSTLHTNSAVETVSRLLNMGVESFNLVSALTCITAQRLCRKVCEKCKMIDEAVTPQVLIEMGIPAQYADKIKAYVGKGCSACNGSGTKGRIAVHEVLKLNDPVREAILAGEPSLRLKRIAMANGMRTLRQSALNKMALGQIPAIEVTSVTASDQEDAPSTKQNAA